MRTVSRNSTIVAAGKIAALALAVLVAPVTDRLGQARAPGAVAAAPRTEAAPACLAAWPSAPCPGTAEPARRVRVIAIGPAAPLAR